MADSNKLRADLKALLIEHKDLGDSEMARIIDRVVYDLYKKKIFALDASQTGKPWTDEELRVVLSVSPTPANIVKFARAFKRGVGSIEDIYRWAMKSNKEIKKTKPGNKFVVQVKVIAKQLGWVS